MDAANRLIRVILAILVLSLGLLPNAHAYTDCTKQLEKLWIGDEGRLWLHYVDGGSAKLTGPNCDGDPTCLGDPDFNATLSGALTALAAGLTIVVRYHENQADCGVGGRTDLRGIYILKP